ncbi:MAG: 4a-hydroxytetrahydrobiopterin dehydratase [Anaerolineaceae bacterium]
MKDEMDLITELKTNSDEILSISELENRLKELPDWKIVHEDSMNKLMREYAFDNFSEVLDFTKLIKKLSSQEDHQPILKSTWGKVSIYWWTHTLSGIQERDFFMASECDRIYLKYKNETTIEE